MLRAHEDIELTKLIKKLTASNDSLAAKVRSLQHENYYLRQGNRVKPHIRTVYRANEGAHKLAILHCAGYRTGRKAAIKAGMSDRTWYASRAMLMLARVHDGENFVTSDPDELSLRIDAAMKIALEKPSKIQDRLPRSRQLKAFR